MRRAVRFAFALAALPLAWGVARAFVDVFRLMSEGGGLVSSGAAAVFAGVLAQVLVWLALPVPARAYVLGHELTHALWGLLFFARPSDLTVGASGGSVKLSKTNLLITLAPYFFPFYTFVVIVSALLTWAFVRPLPCLPLWMFMIGFTWAFHVLFTLETLTQSQPDVKSYGRVFSWTLIFIGNVGLVLVWLAVTTQLTFAQLGDDLLGRVLASYSTTGALLQTGFVRLVGLFRG